MLMSIRNTKEFKHDAVAQVDLEPVRGKWVGCLLLAHRRPTELDYRVSAHAGEADVWQGINDGQ